jgi:cyclase
MIYEIAQGVFNVKHRWIDGNNGIVFGKRRAVAIDASAYHDEGEAMAEFIRSQGYHPLWLALTHGHVDHIGGGLAFAQAEIFAHATTSTVIYNQLPGWAEKSGLSTEEEAAQTIWPTVTFDDKLQIDLGGRWLFLFATPGHSEDSICIYLPDERLLFTGDTVSTATVPAIADGDSRILERSLRELLNLNIEILVPGHGPLLTGERQIREWLHWMIGYITSLRQYVNESLDHGEDPDNIVSFASYERFVGQRLPVDQHHMPRRHQMTVAKIVEEEIAARGE